MENITRIVYALKVKVKSLSHVQFFVTPWTVVCQAPLSMEFFRQEYWSRLPFSTPGDLPQTGIKPSSPAFPARAGRFSTTEPHGNPSVSHVSTLYRSLLKWYTNPKHVSFSLVFYKVKVKSLSRV